ncbi:protein-disulfide reductase DsbD [Vreelandella alkaliphila]|uniref:Thiol:disulfide interchange protein DsbD n=1 Tax=Vreelandella alkaliphila TaxID=272774 RepID=A0AAJ2VM69_9GAMM|nr:MULTISPECIES: protein-disulfide reductase DsbD [Halomonas]MDX5976197.1 protein-disulfide reductase DsbD [Halomonas alkaliphila]PAU72607.1 thiol:disulfide interchange protein [Halomonas humidisoli]
MLPFKRLSLLLLLCWLPLLAHAQWFSSSSNQSDFLPVLEAFQPTAWHDGSAIYIGIDIADDYYLYRHQFSVSSKTDAVSLDEPLLPQGTFTTDEFMGDVYVFRDKLVFETPFSPSYSGPIDIELTFQGCADAGLCYPPETISLEALESSPPTAFADWDAADHALSGAEGSDDQQISQTAGTNSSTEFSAPQSEDSRFSALLGSASLPLALGLFFIAGLGLTFTPCVLPMVPILSSIIVGQKPTRPRAFVLSASYVLGMASTYALVGVLMGLFGAGLNLQAHLQSAPVLITFAVLFTLFALAMFGAFDLRVSPRLAAKIDGWQARAQQSGPAGLALAGALSVLVVSPCVTAPLAGALVFISSTGNAAMGGAVLFALGLGMGVPLLLVGTFGATLLPRSGAWMNGVKIAFGLLLLGVAIWMVERLVPPSIALLLWAALAIGSALMLGALNMNQSQGWPKARQTLGLMLLAWGIALVIGAAQGGSNPLRPLTVSSSSTDSGTPQATLAFQQVDELSALETALSEAASAQQPAFVNFTADWCISCKLMERDVFPDPNVVAALNDFRLIEVDVTNTDAQSRELLNRFNLFGPPSLLFFSQGEEVRDARIQGEITATQLVQHLEALRRWQQG